MKLQPPPVFKTKKKPKFLFYINLIAKVILLVFFSDWWAFAQAASCFGFFGILVSFFLVILYLFVDSCKGNGEVATGAAILCLVTGNFMAKTTRSMVILTLPCCPLPLLLLLPTDTQIANLSLTHTVCSISRFKSNECLYDCQLL